MKSGSGHPVTAGDAGNPVPVIKENLMLSVRLNKNTGSAGPHRDALDFSGRRDYIIDGSSLRFHTFNCVAPVSWWAAVGGFPFPC